MILWQNKITPYLYDAQNIWVTVFSETKMDLEAHLTILYKAYTFSRFGQRLFMPAEVTKKERETRKITKPVQFSPMGRPDMQNNLWLGMTRFYLEPQTTVRITITPGKSDAVIKKKIVTVHESGKVTVETEEPLEIQDDQAVAPAQAPDAGFLSAQANFTNSRGESF